MSGVNALCHIAKVPLQVEYLPTNHQDVINPSRSVGPYFRKGEVLAGFLGQTNYTVDTLRFIPVSSSGLENLRRRGTLSGEFWN